MEFYSETNVCDKTPFRRDNARVILEKASLFLTDGVEMREAAFPVQMGFGFRRDNARVILEKARLFLVFCYLFPVSCFL